MDILEQAGLNALQGFRQHTLEFFRKAKEAGLRESSFISGWLSDEDIIELQKDGSTVRISPESGELFYKITFGQGTWH